MPFMGFEDLKYPEYEVITPQTKISFRVRSLNVQEEERLKASLVTPTKVTEHLNKCIYDIIIKPHETIKDYDSFLKNTTMKDRDALLYGIHHITYEEIRNYELQCSSCSKKFPITVKISDAFNCSMYPGNDILTKKTKVKLPVSKGVSAYIKQPRLIDEIEYLRSLSSRPGTTTEMISEILIIDKFEQEILESKEPKIYNDITDILDAYMSLPARDRRAIYEKYKTEFGQYGVDLKIRTFCQFCGFEEVRDLDLVEQFFRSIYVS